MNVFKSRLQTLLLLGLCGLTVLFCAMPALVSAHSADSVIAQRPATVRLQRANVFELQGDRVRITYAATSTKGEPELRYQDGQRQLNFSGSQIRSTDSEIGKLVTVTLEQVPDLRTKTLTLVLPIVNLPEGTSQRPVQTIAIDTVQRTSIAGPDSVEGQVQTYRTLRLRGVARLLKF